jgi:UrcA family protein
MMQILVKVAVGMCASALIGNMVIAQQVQEVTVQASRVVTKEVGRSGGIPIVDVSLSYGVSYAGLDLVKHADVMELEKRVKDAADKACKELSRQYPLDAADNTDCSKTAADKAMMKVHELATAAAQGSGR